MSHLNIVYQDVLYKMANTTEFFFTELFASVVDTRQEPLQITILQDNALGRAMSVANLAKTCEQQQQAVLGRRRSPKNGRWADSTESEHKGTSRCCDTTSCTGACPPSPPKRREVSRSVSPTFVHRRVVSIPTISPTDITSPFQALEDRRWDHETSKNVKNKYKIERAPSLPERRPLRGIPVDPSC